MFPSVGECSCDLQHCLNVVSSSLELAQNYTITTSGRTRKRKNEASSKTDTMDSRDPGKFRFKLVLLGESAVGKSSVVVRFSEGQFTDQVSTVGGLSCLEIRAHIALACFIVQEVRIDNKTTVGFDIWDTAGQVNLYKLWIRLIFTGKICYLGSNVLPWCPGCYYCLRYYKSCISHFFMISPLLILGSHLFQRLNTGWENSKEKEPLML